MKFQILAYICWSLLVLLLNIGGCYLAFAEGGDLRGHCTDLDCNLSAIKSAVQLQGRDSDAKPEKIPKEESWNFAQSDHYNNIDTVGPTALVAAVKCAVRNTSAFQQTSTSAMHQINISNAVAIERSAAKSSLRQESNTHTPVAPTQAIMPHQSASDRTAELKGKRCNTNQSNCLRIL